MTAALVIDGLNFELRRSPQRRTISITVDRGGELKVTAPAQCPDPQIEQVVRSRLIWIYTALARKNLLHRDRLPLQYVPGESHLYLGRRHRILLVGAGHPAPLRLINGRFELARSERHQAGELFRRWYVARAKERLTSRLEALAPHVDARPRRMEIRDLGYRWGSCSRGVVYFHWRVMQLSPRLAEYVVAHELVHLREPRHGPGFWRLLRRVMPDSEERKHALAAADP